MCPPVLAVGGAGLAAAGAIAGGLSSARQMRAQAKVDDANAKFANAQARDAIAGMETEAARRYRQAALLDGAQKATMAANGIDLDFGSAAQVARDTAMYAREDVTEIYKQGLERARGFDRNASSYNASASANRSRATGAIISSVMSAGGTVLGAAGQFGSIRGAGAYNAYGIKGSDGIY